MKQRNPLLPNTSALRRGAPFEEGPASQFIERGTIISVYPDSLACDINTLETNSRLVGVPLPNLQQDPQGAGGHIEIPRVGTQVYVQRGVGTPFILGYMPVSVSRATARTTTPVLLGLTPQEMGSRNDNAAASYLSALPSGFRPGDWVHIGDQGQFLGVFNQGVSALYAGAWSHVIGTVENDTLNIAGRNLNIRTGAGNLLFTDQGGKQSVKLQLGTDQMTETGTGKDNWPLTLQIGGETPNLLDFILRDRAGADTFRTGISLLGDIHNYAAGAHFSEIGSNRTLTIGGDNEVTVKGNEIHKVGGDQTNTIKGSRASNVSQNIFELAMNDRTDFINRNWDISVGKNMNLQISGSKPAIPKAPAAKWMISNGSLVIDIGFPGTDLGSAMSGFALTTYMPGGNIVFGSVGGNFVVNTVLPNSVLLGANAGIAPFRVVKWEAGLQLFLMQLLAWLDTHTHPVIIGGAPVGHAAPPVVPSTPLLTPTMVAIPSQRVLVGL